MSTAEPAASERISMSERVPMPVSLYVHIPFCETKCPYCDFNTYAAIEPLMPSYMAALQSEIVLWGRLLHRPKVHTIFFGGGTPSYLPAGDIIRTMTTIHAAFDVQADAEVTLEANPGDFSADKLEAYLDCGINRLSIGVQSFDDDLLRTLGRRHNAADAANAYRQAATAGLDNISIDLMYGLPQQSAEQWQDTLSRALDLSPPHISMYCLTLEGGTPMERWVEQGSMLEPDADLAADMYIRAQDEMRRAGYRHYEISNWAQDGKRSLHNLTYWRNEPYLGVGPGAHSYIGGYRFNALKSPREYIRLLQDMAQDAAAAPAPNTRANTDNPAIRATIDSVPVVDEIEYIDMELEMAETMMMGLRLDEGISVSAFERRFGAPPSAFYANTLDELRALSLLREQDGALRLTHRGRMLGNEVFSRFFA
ncbi:MAG: radical SAM family heme chaperone HemW [Chloroflexota bacterium]|nr:radical SAM family heme chaperone HemW [Chloroflexota bacterium]